VNIQDIIARWTGPDAPRFATYTLFDENTCTHCAQGDVLHVAGFSDDELMRTTQEEAEEAVARVLGITRFEAAMLAAVNDSGRSPADFLRNPAAMLGTHGEFALKLARIAQDHAPHADFHTEIRIDVRKAFQRAWNTRWRGMLRSSWNDTITVVLKDDHELYALAFMEHERGESGLGHQILGELLA
jgi:hypothetical protein